MKWKKYLSLTRAGILEALQYRLGLFVMVIGNLIYLIIVYFLWRAIYASAGTDVVNGMTFSDTLIYLVLATALFAFMEMYIVWEMGRSIQTGAITLTLLKPMSYRSYSFWNCAGGVIVQFFCTFLPTFLVVLLVTKGAIPLGINLLYFAVSVILSVSINFSIDLFVGTICMYTESIWGINIMKQVVVLLLSGATIPLAFFPEPLKTIAYCLPFQSIYNAPLSLLLTANPQPSVIAETLGMQLVWSIVTMGFSRLFWQVSLRRITVNGG